MATALKQIQLGKETVRGTAVAATTQLIGEADLVPEYPVHRNQHPIGVYSEFSGASIRMMKEVSIPVRMEANYAQLLHFLLMGIKGGVTPTGAGPYTWTFLKSETADPAPNTFTVERRLESGGSNFDEEVEYVFARALTLRGAFGEVLALEADLVGRQLSSSTLTTVAVPTTDIEPMPLSLAKVYIDDTWAALGTTQVTGQVLDLSVVVNTGLFAGRFIDGTETFSAYKVRAYSLRAELTLEYAGQVHNTEKAKALAQNGRFVRLEFPGTASRSFKIDMALRHENAEIASVSERDGMEIARLALVGFNDPTSGNTLQFEVINNLAALP